MPGRRSNAYVAQTAQDVWDHLAKMKGGDTIDGIAAATGLTRRQVKHRLTWLARNVQVDNRQPIVTLGNRHLLADDVGDVHTFAEWMFRHIERRVLTILTAYAAAVKKWAAVYPELGEDAEQVDIARQQIKLVAKRTSRRVAQAAQKGQQPMTAAEVVADRLKGKV